MIKKILFTILCSIIPVLAFSDSTGMSFNPPASDQSVGFLANIFGIVDGVLHGTGSQIMGAMFQVFNSAVMALGGIIVTYTMLVSTINTAHEGEMLGKEWNSIWIPVRATAGFALLIPKASGYCLMQIFVMWIVVQGAGAADKIWSAALSYLNRGGVIIQAQANPTQAIFGNTGGDQATKGAMYILSGQVCMLSVEQTLKNLLEFYKSQSSTVCTGASTTTIAPGTAPNQTSTLMQFCNSEVPSFTGSIDMTSVQKTAISSGTTSSASSVNLLMPNFSSTDNNSIYQYLNGICGQISWELMTSSTDTTAQRAGPIAYAQSIKNTEQQINALTAEANSFDPSSPSQLAQRAHLINKITELQNNELTTATQAAAAATAAAQQAEQNETTSSSTQGNYGLTNSEMKQVRDARVAAIQQMYNDLLPVAQLMVNNDTKITTAIVSSTGTTKINPNAPQQTEKAKRAVQQFGVPITGNNGEACQTGGGGCKSWGPAASDTKGVLLNGTELQSSVLDYIGVMQPTITLLEQNSSSNTLQQSKAFITKAEQKGWIMAGSYFFDLVALNAQNRNTTGLSDINSGLDQSKFDISTIINSFSSPTQCNPANAVVVYTQWPAATPTFPVWCWLLNGTQSYANNIVDLFTSNPSQEKAPPVTLVGNGQSSIKLSSNNSPADDPSTVFGYLNNALMIKLPGQAGEKPLDFTNTISINFNTFAFSLPPLDMQCGHVFFIGCIGEAVAKVIYNSVMLPIFQFVVNTLTTLINDFIMKLVMIPLKGFAAIFLTSVNILDTPGINPIVALANMGTFYINFVGNLWQVSLFQLISYIITIVGILLVPIIAIILPLIVAMAGIMLSIGFLTAYYVPLLPYMIFTFGSIAWLMAVIEAMVAAPIVALGVIHPEGQHKVFGRAEAAIMILMNVFLRPSMMIIGYIAAISVSYVGVWVLNAGFDQAMQFMNPTMAGASQFGGGESVNYGAFMGGATSEGSAFGGTVNVPSTNIVGAGTVSGGYTGWAAILEFFFSVIIYAWIYWTIVEKAFTLIAVLPDKVLRWISGQPETYGEGAAQWAEQAKGKIEKAGEEARSGMTAVNKSVQGGMTDAASTLAGGVKGGSAGSEGGEQPPTPKPPP